MYSTAAPRARIALDLAHDLADVLGMLERDEAVEHRASRFVDVLRLAEGDDFEAFARGEHRARMRAVD
jgi:hypothetical protein